MMPRRPRKGQPGHRSRQAGARRRPNDDRLHAHARRMERRYTKAGQKEEEMNEMKVTKEEGVELVTKPFLNPEMETREPMPASQARVEQPAAETSIHESRLAPSAEAYKAPENHLFRKAYRKLEPHEAALMDALKDKANELHALITSRPKSRYTSLAVTALEESVMWAVKDITA